jgi:hypothetical protein
MGHITAFLDKGTRESSSVPRCAVLNSEITNKKQKYSIKSVKERILVYKYDAERERSSIDLLPFTWK